MKQVELLATLNATALEQAKSLVAISEQLTTVIKYQNAKDRALLRRHDYSFLRPGKLVVVVADFSAGGAVEGAEIADEIGNTLQELKKKCDIDIDILVGEVAPGVVIRNEVMAQDIGQHLPKGTCYAVVWGNLSPKTVGMFRTHVTCVLKVDDAQGLSRSYTIDPESQRLPKGETEEEQRRDEFAQLISFTCAVIPGCYASYELTQDRRPNLEKYYAYLQADAPKAVEQYREELKPLMTWIDHREPKNPAQPNFKYLRRLSPISKETEYPQLVRNTRDDSVMTLIVDPKTNRPKVFDDPSGGKCVVYMDVTETTNRQYLLFLNAEGNRNVGGVNWINTDVEDLNKRNTPYNITGGPKIFGTGKPKEDLERPVINVSWYGADDYCKWARKALPTKEEWQAAAAPTVGKRFPWGDATDNIQKRCATGEDPPPLCPTRRVGSFALSDKSHIGCLDMAGNVAEWCADARPAGEYVVCGGDWKAPPAHFEIANPRSAPAVTRDAHIGFRGVVRIKIDEHKK